MIPVPVSIRLSPSCLINSVSPLCFLIGSPISSTTTATATIGSELQTNSFTTTTTTTTTSCLFQSPLSPYRPISSSTIVATAKRQNPSIAKRTTMSSTDTDNVIVQKQSLRRQIRSQLQVMSDDAIQKQSTMVWERLVRDIPAYQTAQSIGLFLSMPHGEIDTNMALLHAIQHGKTIYVPHVGTNFENADMDLIQVTANAPATTTTGLTSNENNNSTNNKDSSNDMPMFHHDWPRNKWGIPEPPPEMKPYQMAQPGDIDILIVPGLAFDRYGNRLGQGKGYYDRFIARMLMGAKDKDSAPSPVLVAVGLRCQFFHDNVIPVNEYDVPVDWIILPDETIQVSK